MEKTDLTNCDREPIHIPGKIQAHGFMIAVDKSFVITHCSENIRQFLNTEAHTLLGQSLSNLENLFSTEGSSSFVKQLVDAGMTIKDFAPQNPYPVIIQQQTFNLVLSQSKQLFILEFEPEYSDLQQELHNILGASISDMLTDSALNQLLIKTAIQIKRIIGYDRVMIYRFHDDGHGEVVAEAHSEGVKPWMGQHYPASDIPAQARELYKINQVRLVSDVYQEPSAVLALPSQVLPLDLTHVGLRAVSPIHIQYLKNMGTNSSFSISLIDNKELWGLVACHNYSPRFINYKERHAAKLVGQILSSAISYRKYNEQDSRKSELRSKVDELIKRLSRDKTLEEALCGHEINMLHAVEATGAVLVYDKKIHRLGRTPGYTFIQALIEWLEEKKESFLYTTDRLPALFPKAMEEKAIASGLLAIRINPELKEYMLWFRKEVFHTIRWAGNQEKQITIDRNNIEQIHPRNSFEVWSQTVQMTAVPWSEADIHSALRLREEVSFTTNRKATEVRLLNEKLKIAYDELDAFSYTISHDLKNPLSSIKGYAQILTRDENLDPKTRQMLDRILSGTGKMQGMIRDILSYSRVGQTKKDFSLLNMYKMLNEIKQELIAGADHSRLKILIENTPAFYGNETMVMQVFSNLIGNAVKFSLKRPDPLVIIQGEESESEITYSIQDNGIGILPNETEKIFGLFTRSDEVADFEGSGVGLAIVKKIMENHQGKIWVETKAGLGSCFYVSFQKPAAALSAN